jgi:alcohol dehydrogenase class IV
VIPSSRPVVEFGDWPGRIIFGRGAVARLEGEAVRLGTSRALVVCGRSVAGGPMLAKVKAGLGSTFVGVFSEVTAHTPVETVERGVGTVQQRGADLLVSAGGGSAIDAAKAIAIVLASNGKLAQHAIRYEPGGEMLRTPLPGRLIRHIAVPTTAGSGSDVMPTAACRDPQSRKKLLFWDSALVPQLTLLDPEMAIYADAQLTAATGMTAVARSIEALYSGKRHPQSTARALHALRLLSAALPDSVARPRDLDARAACQMAAVMASMAAINAMASLVHAIGHVVGARYGLQHGICHAILLAPAMRLLLPVIGDEQSLVCDALTRTKSAREGNCSAASAAEAMAELVRRLPLPQRLREAGVQAGELAEIASETMSDYMMANLPKPLSQEEVLGLLRQAW